MYHGDTFGNATAKYFQDRRTAEFQTSVMRLQGVSGDGKFEFPTLYSNNKDLVLSARTRTRERWYAAPKYSLFNSHERAKQLQAFDKVHIYSGGGGVCKFSTHFPSLVAIIGTKVRGARRRLSCFSQMH